MAILNIIQKEFVQSVVFSVCFPSSHAITVMASKYPIKKRNINPCLQLSVTKFLRSTSATRRNPTSIGDCTSKDCEESIGESPLEIYDNATRTDRESSPELFSSPVYSDTMSTATDKTLPTPANDESVPPAGEPSSQIPQPCTSRGLSTSTSTSPQSGTNSSRSSSTTPETEPWSGVPLNELCFGPSAYPVLPHLRASHAHSVLFHPQLKPGFLPRPFPDKFRDVWDQHHVRMPCSSESMYPTERNGIVLRWDLIKDALKKPLHNSFDLEEALLSYNSHYSKKWNFSGLHTYFQEVCSEEENSSFFGVLLPQIIDLALSLPNIVTHGVPLLKKQQNYSLTLSQQQIACLLANAFLCTFPRRNTRQRSTEYAKYPSINFSGMFSPSAGHNDSQVNKLKCLFHYFTRVMGKMPEGVVTFHRHGLNTPLDWGENCAQFTKLHVTSQGNIEDQGHGMLQVDFANMYIGGGVLGKGCVQEEIRFLICPELIVSRLFTEELDNNECLVIIGPERFSNYRGYSSSFEWSGSHRDETMRDSWGRIQTHIVAIDATHYRSYASQFLPGAIRRELNKALCGFSDNDHQSLCGRSMAVATGNWGCGAFKGDRRLKSLLQLMAAAVAGRDVAYFTYGDYELQKDLSSFHSALIRCGVTVGQVWSALINYRSFRNRPDKPSLYSYLRTVLTGERPHPYCDRSPDSPPLSNKEPAATVQSIEAVDLSNTEVIRSGPELT